MKKAFTLIELLVVVAIIAILATMLIPAVSEAMDLAKRTACISRLHSLVTSCAMYSQQYNGWVPCDYTYIPMGAFYVGYSSVVIYYDKRWSGLGLLYEEEIVSDPKMLYCPAQDSSESGSFEYYSSMPGLWSPTYDKWGIIYGQYMYRTMMASDPMSTNPQTWRMSEHGQEAFIADRCVDVYGKSMVNRHGVEGVNAGYVDGHVSWVADRRLYDGWGGIPVSGGLLSQAIEDQWTILDEN